MKPVILVVEDEPPLQQLLSYNLKAAGFEVAQAYDGEEALQLIDESVPDLVLLDWMLPEVSGVELCRRLRRRSDTARVPIIMLTARTEEHDRLRGLEAGADDYVTKPFSPAELIARIRAVLRRVRPAFSEQALSFHDLRMDLTAHRVFSRAQLLDRVWGTDLEIELRTVDATVRRLRRSLNHNGEDDLLRTVRAEGYSLDLKHGVLSEGGLAETG
jgi:two-component system phosphate regulon response regulator PhoB